jgi:uncharacterized membrane protein (DUF485 family)
MPESNPEVTSPNPAPEHTAHEILEDPEFQALARKKNTFSLALTLVTFVVYFGYMGLLALESPALAQKAGGAASMGIPLGIGIIIAAWILTGVYVMWANGSYDNEVNRVKSKVQ